MTGGAGFRVRGLRDEVEALVRPRGWILAALLGGGSAAAALLAFGPGAPGPAEEGLLGILLLEGSVLALILVEGLVATDVRRGWALLWLQRRISPVAFYLAALARCVGLYLVLFLAAAGLQVAVYGLGRGPGLAPLQVIPVSALLGLVLIVITFGFSAWRAHPDLLVATAYVFLSTPLAAVATWDRSAFGALGPVIRGAAPPVDALLAIWRGWLRGWGGVPADQGLHVAAYLVTWLGIGLAGLLVTGRQPFPRER